MSNIALKIDKKHFGIDWTACYPADAKAVSIKKRDKFGNTPLHYAARFSYNTSVIDSLIGIGADVKARNESGDTPLHFVTYNSVLNVHDTTYQLHPNFVSLPLNTQNKHGETPLLLALKNANPNFASYLIGKNADVNAKDKANQTPLLMAVKNGDKQMVRELLKKNAIVCSDALEAGKSDQDFNQSDEFWLLNNAFYNQKEQ